jgi:SAM-dependent methyltransferase
MNIETTASSDYSVSKRKQRMTRFEWVSLFLIPFLPPLYGKVRSQLMKVVKENAPNQLNILDVGGRKSHYTVGIPASITITDLPRESSIQKQHNLGITDAIIAQTKSRRSNVKQILFDDMTHSQLPDESFDCVVAVEVLEHVEEDAQFIQNVWRVLRPGGVFLMTTPNGDFVKNINPDHKRHYKRAELNALLQSCFGKVEVIYAIKGSRFRTLGLKGWSAKHPLSTALSMTGNLINLIQSARKSLNNQMIGTRNLIAVAVKQDLEKQQ